MGGRSTSANQTTTTNVSGQNGIQGDNLGVSAAGINGNLNINMSDAGAMAAASDMAKQAGAAMNGAVDLGNTALEESLKMVTENIGAALDASAASQSAASKMAAKAYEDALAATTKSQSQAFDFGESAIEAAAKTSRDAIAANKDLLEDSLDFGNNALTQNSKVSQQALEQMRKNSEETVNLAHDIAGQSATTTKEVIALSKAMNGTAEKIASQGQTGSSDSMAKVAMVSALAFGIAMAIRG
ncbi:hypothetical protein [Vibrio fluvialis]|uniref:hypothetical protein n=1 Tax=Vibrio fluvialis TaxID=676 RepID=UPI003D7DF573